MILSFTSSVLKGFNELEKLLKASEICIAATEKMIKDSGVAGQATYDKTVERLLAKSNARGKTPDWLRMAPKTICWFSETRSPYIDKNPDL